jgi:hypothetical protein
VLGVLFVGYKNWVLINNGIMQQQCNLHQSDGTVKGERDKEIIILMSKYTLYNMKPFPSLQKKLREERNAFPDHLN